MSVVIASINGRPYIDDCLEALSCQQGDVQAEIIVVDCVGPAVVAFIRADYPQVTVLAFDEKKSVPQLRAAGILAANGSIIALTEDHCLPEPNWFEAVIDAHQRHDNPAIGGAVDNAATSRLVDWAAFFCEYSAYISPVPAGVVHDLPGPNVSYKRQRLLSMAALFKDGYRETFLHQQLEAAGYGLWSDPALVVQHKKHFTLGGFLKERFHYGRWFGGMRNEAGSPVQRAVYLLLSPLLPVILSARLTRRVYSRRRHLPEFVRAFPILLLFLLAWAAGEFVGYGFGSGNSVYEIS